MKKKFSIVIPIYNNEKNLPVTMEYIYNHLHLFEKYDIEIILVNDGSKDASYEVMHEIQRKYDLNITIANLARNFGQGACELAGLELATGDVIGVISSDMQDPFEFFATMLQEWENGFDFVYGIRNQRTEKGIASLGAKIMHKFMHRFVSKEWPKGGSDFYIMDKKVVKQYIPIAKNKYNSGLSVRLYLTNKKKGLPYTRKSREIGKSGYKISKKFFMAWNWMLIYSDLPVKFTYYSSLFFGILTIAFFVAFLISSQLLLIGFSFASMATCFILMCMGMLLSYVHRIFEIQQNSPRYVIDEVINKNEIEE